MPFVHAVTHQQGTCAPPSTPFYPPLMDTLASMPSAMLNANVSRPFSLLVLLMSMCEVRPSAPPATPARPAVVMVPMSEPWGGGGEGVAHGRVWCVAQRGCAIGCGGVRWGGASGHGALVRIFGGKAVQQGAGQGMPVGRGAQAALRNEHRRAPERRGFQGATPLTSSKRQPF